ncbi:MAG: hypothetical protein V7K12_21070, partial [Nostoc sp.]
LDERPYSVTSVNKFSVFIYLYIIWFFHADLLTAIARGLTLVSNDSDLLRVQGINLENWVSYTLE